MGDKIKNKFKYIESKKNNKLYLDKYYTSYDNMKYCVDKTLEVLKSNGYEISEFLEPSAGAGVFSNYLATSGLDVVAIDIEPDSEDIIKADYLEYPLEYVKGRCIIGNPPYGERLNLARQFFKKSIEIGDYISFILPISQLNNISIMFKFDLIYSEDLGKLIFSGDRYVHCCLNVYVRPKNGLNKKKSNKLKDVSICETKSKKYETFEYDLRMCNWGNATAGKILSDEEHYSSEFKIKIHNNHIKDKIIELLHNTDWRSEIKSSSMLKIQQHHIIDLLKRNIEGIK